MTSVDEIDELLVERIAFPAVNYLLNRRNIQGRYRALLATERWPAEAVRELQFQKLARLLRRACTWSPFYAKRFKDLGLVPEDIRSLDDFRRIPPLDRRDLLDHRLDILDSRSRKSALAADRAAREPGLPFPPAIFSGHRLVRNTSTGSTGTPTVFYEDGSTSAMNWVHEQRLKSWYGLAPGVNEARLKGISTGYAVKSVRRFIREHLWNQLMLPGFFLSEADYTFALSRILKFKPRVLWGPAPGLAGLARYIQRNRSDTAGFHPDLVITWAAPLHAHEQRLLHDVFGCPVSNLYSTREVGHVAMLCPYGSFHINQEHYIVEIESAKPPFGGDHGAGEILVTPLFDSPMPFLRYRVGDLAEPGADACACGRGLATLSKILGRTGDVFVTDDGRLVEPNFWCLAFMSGRPSQTVEQFQVIYRRRDLICLRIAPRLGYSADTEDELRRFFTRNFPPSIRFEFEYVAEIPPQPSGKTPIVINESDAPVEQPVHR